MNRDEIFTKVSHVLVDALGIDVDDVTLDSRIKADLGAESIDFLDIVYRLEKTFGIDIPRDDLFPDEQLFTSPEFVQDGMMTKAGIADLRRRMPWSTDLDTFAENPQVMQLTNLFTVQMITAYVEEKLNSVST